MLDTDAYDFMTSTSETEIKTSNVLTNPLARLTHSIYYNVTLRFLML